MKPLILAAFFMHIFHYFTIFHFAQCLNQELQNWELQDCFSQNKDEIIFHFFKQENSKYLIINCTSPFPFYYLTHSFSKARRNTATLFEEVIGLNVLEVSILEGERVIIIHLEKQHQIVLKLFGKLSNVIHYYYNQVEDIFRHSLEEDEYFLLKPNPAFQQFLDFLNNDSLSFEDLLSLPYWDKSFKNFILNAQNLNTSAIEVAIQLYEIYLFPQFYVSKNPLHFSLIKQEQTWAFQDVKEALSTFVKFYYNEYQFKVYYSEIDKQIHNRIKQYEYKVNSYQKSIENIEKSRSYEEIGNIIMANLHLPIANQDRAVFTDFYHDYQPIEIVLKPDFTLQQNAEWYYQKHKKRKKELLKLEDLFKENQSQLQKWQQIKKELETLQDLKSLQKWLKNYPELLLKPSEKQELSLPYREFIIDNYKIWVGKDAKSNDQLTLHFSHKNDIWLHAKDVSGSHVLIKTQKNHQVPKSILTHAAELAGFYSKNRNQSFIPVIYTEKKYVRKGKGLPPGKVFVERENVIFVEPKSYEKIVHELNKKS